MAQAEYRALSPPGVAVTRRQNICGFMLSKFIPALLLVLTCSNLAARGVYQQPEDFLSDTFTGSVPDAAVIWLTGERKDVVTQLLGHSYPSLRVRYWRRDQRSAWVLEEIGKEQPITVGLVIRQGRLERIKVLEFRESRGWEVRHSFFTDQFRDARLDEQRNLDRHIDGISGATLSVRAMKKLAALALYLDGEVRAQDVPASP
jgi:hypothetical protein